MIDRQIFIGGCSRSGTTLLGAMLGAHRQAICTPESHFKIDVLRSPIFIENGVDQAAALDFIERHWRFKIWQLSLAETAVSHEEDGETSFACLMNAIVHQYAAQQNKPEASIWVDHTPENISYVRALLQQFPQAKFIHIVRDGRAVAASIMPLDWGPNSIIKASRWWMRMVSFGLAAESAFGAEQVTRIRYEDLVADPEGVLRPLSQFLGIDFEPAMTAATGFNPPAYTTKQHTLIGQKPDRKMASSWEHKLSARQIEIFESQTRDYLTYLGYSLRFGLKAKPPTFWEIQKGKVKELIQGEIGNKIKWLIRSYPVWLSRDFYKQTGLSDTNN